MSQLAKRLLWRVQRLFYIPSPQGCSHCLRAQLEQFQEAFHGLAGFLLLRATACQRVAVDCEEWDAGFDERGPYHRYRSQPVPAPPVIEVHGSIHSELLGQSHVQEGTAGRTPPKHVVGEALRQSRERIIRIDSFEMHLAHLLEDHAGAALAEHLEELVIVVRHGVEPEQPLEPASLVEHRCQEIAATSLAQQALEVLGPPLRYPHKSWPRKTVAKVRRPSISRRPARRCAMNRPHAADARLESWMAFLRFG